MTRSLLAMRCSQPFWAPSITRYENTFISYQGLCTASRAVPALDLRLLEVGGPKRREKPHAKPFRFGAAA